MDKKVPNILIITTDEHNPRISSPYGHPFVKTPNMDRLASEGITYENAYCPSPLCQPSRSAFMFGLPVHKVQSYNNCCTTETTLPSYGEILKSQGVHTVHFGKSDVTRHYDKLGFSEMDGSGFRDPGDLNFSRNPLTVRPVETPQGGTRFSNYGPVEDRDPYEIDRSNYSKAESWLRDKAAALDKPWNLAVNTSKPHFPMWTTPELWDLYDGHDDLSPYGGEEESANHPRARELREHFQTHRFTEKASRSLRRGYYAHVTFMDSMLGRLLDTLEETGQRDNTIVILTSDHGDMLGKFDMWWKCSLYDDSSRIPLIVSGPGFPRNTRLSLPVDHFDLMASIFESHQCEKPGEWPGTPLQDLTEESDHVAFCEYHGHGNRGSGYMVRKNEWKLIYYPSAPCQLFNMKEDPEELVNLYSSEKARADELEKELFKICDPEKEEKRAEEFIMNQLQDIENMNLTFRGGGHAIKSE